MGNGIAQAAARAGFAVVMRDVSEEFLRRGVGAIERSLQRDVDKERLKEDEKRAIVSRVRTTTEIGELGEASFVIEAITENLEAKRELFRALDRAVKED